MSPKNHGQLSDVIGLPPQVSGHFGGPGAQVDWASTGPLHSRQRSTCMFLGEVCCYSVNEYDQLETNIESLHKLSEANTGRAQPCSTLSGSLRPSRGVSAPRLRLVAIIGLVFLLALSHPLLFRDLTEDRSTDSQLPHPMLSLFSRK